MDNQIYCRKCKSWQAPAEFFSNSGRKVATCNSCRGRAKTLYHARFGKTPVTEERFTIAYAGGSMYRRGEVITRTEIKEMADELSCGYILLSKTDGIDHHYRVDYDPITKTSKLVLTQAPSLNPAPSGFKKIKAKTPSITA